MYAVLRFLISLGKSESANVMTKLGQQSTFVFVEFFGVLEGLSQEKDVPQREAVKPGPGVGPLVNLFCNFNSSELFISSCVSSLNVEVW